MATRSRAPGVPYFLETALTAIEVKQHEQPNPDESTVMRGDYAPYNFFTIFSDGFIGIWILVLLYLYWRQGGFRK